MSSFEGKLVKMIKEVNDRFDGYSISPKFRKSLLHWGDLFFCLYKNGFFLVHQKRIIKKSKRHIT